MCFDQHMLLGCCFFSPLNDAEIRIWHNSPSQVHTFTGYLRKQSVHVELLVSLVLKAIDFSFHDKKTRKDILSKRLKILVFEVFH